MNRKNWIVAALLRVYPTSWRREYGPELADMLLARPLKAGVVANVLRGGLWQRLRVAEPSTLAGTVMLLAMLGAFARNIIAPSPHDVATVLLQYFWRSNLYIELLAGCGFWTYLRHGDVSGSGKAGVKLALLTGIPTMLAGILMLAGVLGVIVLSRWDIPTTFREHGFAYTYYDEAFRSCWVRVQQPTGIFKAIESAACPPAPLGVLVAPLFALPVAWLWGTVGGWLGRVLFPRRRRPVASA